MTNRRMEPKKSNRAKKGILVTTERIATIAANIITGMSSRKISVFDVM
jgi:hypothetical protein